MTEPLDFAALALPAGVAGDDTSTASAFGVELEAAGVFPESLSRWGRFQSAPRSADTWYRTSALFSNALVNIPSNSAGRVGFSVTGEIGPLCRMLSKMTALVEP